MMRDKSTVSGQPERRNVQLTHVEEEEAHAYL